MDNPTTGLLFLGIILVFILADAILRMRKALRHIDGVSTTGRHRSPEALKRVRDVHIAFTVLWIVDVGLLVAVRTWRLTTPGWLAVGAIFMICLIGQLRLVSMRSRLTADNRPSSTSIL